MRKRRPISLPDDCLASEAMPELHRNCNATGAKMKTATFPSLRVTPEFRQAAEQVLQEGESLSSFVEKSIRENITRRQLQSEFVARGLASREHARETGGYVSADAVLGRLDKMLASAKSGK
jgi:hypothetical protein